MSHSIFPSRAGSCRGVAALGFGAAPIGNLYHEVEEAAAITTVRTAFDAGIRYFDTAPHYGFGLSEQRLGRAIQSLPRESFELSTKVGRRLQPVSRGEYVRHGFAGAADFEPVFDYSYDGVMRSFESSLQRLQTDYIDTLLVHDLGRQTHGDAHQHYLQDFLQGGYRAMDALKNQRLIRAIGLGANEWQIGETLLSAIDLDCILLAGRYTLLEQQPCDHFMSLCQQRRVSLIAAAPFNSGILASGTGGEGPWYYNYEPAPLSVINRVKQLEVICYEFGVPLAAAALQFPVAHPVVSHVLAGFSNNEELLSAVALMNFAIPVAFWEALHQQQLIHPDAPVPSASIKRVAEK